MTGRHGRSPRTGWNQRSPPKYLSLPPPQLPFGPPLLKSNPYSILDEQFSSPAKVHAQSAIHLDEQEQFSHIINDKKQTAKTSNSININDSMSKQKSVTCNTYNSNTKYKKTKRTKSFRDRYKEKLDRYMSLNTINDNSPTESKIKKPPSPIRTTTCSQHKLFSNRNPVPVCHLTSKLTLAVHHVVSKTYQATYRSYSLASNQRTPCVSSSITPTLTKRFKAS